MSAPVQIGNYGVDAETGATTWRCDRCGLIMLALAQALHEALHEHVQPTTPRPPDPRIDDLRVLIEGLYDRLDALEGVVRGGR